MKVLTCGFMGSSEVSLEVLRILIRQPQIKLTTVWSNPPSPSGRGKNIKDTSVISLAKTLPGVDIRELERIGDKEIQYLKSHTPDFILVAACGHILPAIWLSLPSLGCYNVHFSLLPRYRGASPVQAAILNGDEESGITIQKISEKLDTGDIVISSSFSIKNLNAPQVFSKSFNELETVLPEFIRILVGGNLKFTPQNHDLTGGYCRKIKKTEGLLNSSMTATEIYRKFLAYQPWPGIYFNLNNQVFIITGIEKPENSSHLAQEVKKLYGEEVFTYLGLQFFKINTPPGLILGVLSNGESISHPEIEFLNITSIQKSGKKSMLIKDFLNGCRWNFPIKL